MPVIQPLWLLLLIVAAIAMLPAAFRRMPSVGLALLVLGATAAGRVEAPSTSFLLINGTLLWSGLLLAGSPLALGRQRLGPARLGFLGLSLVLAVVMLAAFRQGRPVVSLLLALAVAALMNFVPERRAVEPTATGGRNITRVRRWVMLAVLSLLLVSASWYTCLVAGTGGIWSTRLPDVPFSDAGETLFAALLLPDTLLLAGVWPVSGLARGARLAPVAALLLYVVILPAAPDGMEHWRSPYALWLLVSALIAAWQSDWPMVLGAGGLFAIACGDATARSAGLVLAIAACVLEVVGPADQREQLRAAVMLCAVAAALLALPGTMTTEVVYSTAFVLVVMVGVLRTPARAAAPELSA